MAPAQSPLAQTAATGTDFWNDSCAIAELEYAISHGAVGATSNPIIVAQVVKQEMSRWKPRIAALAAELPTAGEEEIAWALNEEMAVGASKLLLPVFERHRGTKGRLSIQTNPTFYRNSKAMLEQALHFHSLAPNVHVKIPATAAGIETVEEATARGVSVNATVSFTVPQALAVAEAVERGLVRAAAAGIDTATMAPTCTIMVGRVDDWLKVIAEKDDVIVDPAALEWAGVAVMKRASVRCTRSLPTGRYSRCSSRRNRLDCSAGEASPISSRNSVPPAAAPTSPVRACPAPENAPLACPNSSLCTTPSESAPQLTATNAPVRPLSS